jgi:ATP-dependent helicase/nuclease subunit A
VSKKTVVKPRATPPRRREPSGSAGGSSASLFPIATTTEEPATESQGSRRQTWTPQQLEAIRTCDRSVLVSAAAGSGKTAVLAERCVHLVCDAPQPCDVDELLVVTFTEAAAAEMRGRIQQALRARLEATDDPRLLKQLALIDRAQVSTLHGFCARLCRQHFHLLDLDPGFDILSGDEAELLRAEIARELFSERYEAENAQPFHAFIDAYGDGNDERLVRKVVSTHELLASLLDPVGWIASARGRLDEALSGELRESALGRELDTMIRRRLVEITRRCDDAVLAVTQLGGFGKYVAALNEARQVLRHAAELLNDGGIDAVTELIRDYKFDKAPALKAGTPGKEIVQGLLKGIRQEITDENGLLAQILRFDAKQWVDGLRAIRPHVDVFLGLVEEFGQRYAAAKKAARAVDFADLERLAVRALRDGASPGLAPSSVARLQHRRFKHVLVDEYQDINEVQDAILRLVSRECVAGEGDCGNLFTVGDVKQSIYRFRLAEPTRFLERDERFRAAGAGGTVIDLQANFRSRAPLLAALNRVFATLMTKQAADIEYDASHELRPGVVYPDGDGASSFRGAPIELHVLPMHASTSTDHHGDEAGEDETDPPDRTAREAVLIARRIAEMMGTGQGGAGQPMQVMERNAAGELTPRDIGYGDIVILLRSMKFKADRYADALRQSGIPVHSESGTGYFESMEVRDVLALLSLLDNQRQDVPLAAILRSPLAALPEPEDSLARIRLAYGGNVAFHQAVVFYANNQKDELAAKLSDFLKQLARWRTLAQRRPLAEVLWTIYRETGYLAFCAGLFGGEQRVANLIDLHERARQFGSFQKQGLARFLNFLEQLREESDLGQPSVASAADDVVRIMSVHASKGLEFPVVIVPDLGKRINLSDCSGSILIDRHAGPGFSVADETRRIRYPSLASMVVQNRLRQQSLAEELRVLYVAMTRAKEHLMLIGTCKDSACETWSTRWSGHAGPLPADVVLGASTTLDWIGPVAAATGASADAPIQLTQHTADEVAAWPNPEDLRPKASPRLQQLVALQPLDPPPPPNAQAEAIVRRLTFERPHAPFADVPATASVSDLAKHGRAAPGGTSASRGSVVSFDRILTAPRVASTELKPLAADVGTGYHLVLQHLDFARPCDAADVREQVARLVQRRLIAPAVEAMIDADAIAWFTSHPLGQTLRQHASRLRRELPIYFPQVAQSTDGHTIAPADPMDRVMIRSRIDVLVETPAALEIVDYKTDAITAETLEPRVEFYRPQMSLYRDAVQAATGRPVAAVHLVFLTAREVVSDPQPPISSPSAVPAARIESA